LREALATAKVNGKWREPQEETVYLITSLSPAVSPQALLCVNRRPESRYV
jgi:hypothetical protein